MRVFGREIGANSEIGRYRVANSGPFCWIMFGISVLMIVVLRISRFKGFALVFMFFFLKLFF